MIPDARWRPLGCVAGRRLRPGLRLRQQHPIDAGEEGRHHRRGAASPDQWDTAALTFAEPVAQHAGWSRRLVYPDVGVA